MQLLSILILLAIFVAVSRRANGYTLEGKAWPAGTVVTFQMGLGSAGRTLIDGNTSWDTAAAPALTAWDNVTARLQYKGNVANPPVSSGDGVNAVVFSNTVFGQQFGSGTLAVTFWRSSGNNIIEADILFNRNQSFDSYRGPLRFNSRGWSIGDIRRVFVHELGHALGLDHPDQHGQHVRRDYELSDKRSRDVVLRRYFWRTINIRGAYAYADTNTDTADAEPVWESFWQYFDASGRRHRKQCDDRRVYGLGVAIKNSDCPRARADSWKLWGH